MRHSIAIAICVAVAAGIATAHEGTDPLAVRYRSLTAADTIRVFSLYARAQRLKTRLQKERRGTGPMADAATTADLLSSGNLSNILNFLTAAAGLGTAAMGLVDSSKAFWGGPSNFGFPTVQKEVGPFLVAAADGPTAFGRAEILRMLKANWVNGVAKADQKAKAKSLIHLGLTRGNAAALATAAGVDAATLTSLAQKTADGITPIQQEINVLGQFDAIVSAVLDAAYERGDQQYRNGCKFLGLAVSTVLGVFGGWIVYGPNGFGIWQFWLSFLVGLSATPLAPVAKDLVSSLQAAASAVSAVKR